MSAKRKLLERDHGPPGALLTPPSTHHPENSYQGEQPEGHDDATPSEKRLENQLHLSNRECIASSVLTSLKELFRKRDQLVEMRVSLAIQRLDCKYQRKHTDTALATFKQAADKFMSEAPGLSISDATLHLLQDDWEHLQMSVARLKLQEEQLREKEDQVNLFESKLQRDEIGAYSQLEKLVESHIRPSAFNSDLDTMSQVSQPTLSASSDATIAREYYAKAQRAYVLRSRLEEFQAEHREEVEARKLHREINQVVEPSEKAFLERYFEKLLDMYRDYATTKEQASQLKLRCQELNIEVDDDQDTNIFDALNASIDPERQLIHHVAVHKSGFRGVKPLEELLFGYVDVPARVKEWLSELQAGHIEPPTPSIRGIPAPMDDSIAPGLDHPWIYDSISTQPTSDLLPPPSLSRGMPSESQTGFRYGNNARSRRSNFEGEWVKYRWSDPGLHQRSLIGSRSLNNSRRKLKSTSECISYSSAYPVSQP